jgi:tRNA(fMet)-specific endonuclease VapC
LLIKISDDRITVLIRHPDFRSVECDTPRRVIKRKPPRLLDRIRQALAANEACISVITRGELLYGLALVPHAVSLARAVHAFLDTAPCLDWTGAAADHYAILRAEQKNSGNPIGNMDTLIAAHALADGLILVTNNGRHFERIPELRIENWTPSALDSDIER